MSTKTMSIREVVRTLSRRMVGRDQIQSRVDALQLEIDEHSSQISQLIENHRVELEQIVNNLTGPWVGMLAEEEVQLLGEIKELMEEKASSPKERT
jgi:hypothetical protein